MAVDTAGFAASIILNTVVCLVCFAIFSILRRSELTKKFYCPKRYAPGAKTPEKLPGGFFAWLVPVWRYSEEELIKVSGLDAAVFIRIIQFGFTIFVWISLWCLVLLIPLNATGGYIDDIQRNEERAKVPKKERSVYSGIDKLYMTNVRPSNPRLWAHAASVYVVTYIVLKLLWQFNRDLSVLRVKFLATQPSGGSTHTVLVTDVPGIKAGSMVDTINRLPLIPQFLKTKLVNLVEAAAGAAQGSFSTALSPGAVSKTVDKNARSTQESLVEVTAEECDVLLDSAVLAPEQAAEAKIRGGADTKALVAHDFKAVYGEDEVVGVNPVYNQEDLDPLFAKYQHIERSLTDLIDHYQSQEKRGKKLKQRMLTVTGPLLGPWGIGTYGMKPKKVDALQHYSAYLTELKRQIKLNEDNAKADFYPSAFVTFKSRASATTAASSLHSHDETVWRTQDAPGAEEVVWENLRLRAWERSLRTALVWVAFVLIILFFMPVTAAIQSLVSIKQLEAVPVIKDIVKISVLRGIIVGILPGIVLQIFLIFLPKILSALNRKAGMVSISQIDLGVVEKFFIFQFITVFLVNAMSGTFLAQAKAIIADGDIVGIVKKIANAIPQQATYFMTYTLVSGVGGKPIAFLRVVGLVIFWILSKLAGSDRAKMRLWANQTQMFGTATTDHVMTILFGVVFCVQAPIIAPICLYYFVVQMLIEKYNAMYVFGRPYESAGRLWAKIYRQIMVAVYVFQIVIILQLSLKGFKFTPLVVPVLLFTFVFDIACTSLFRRPWTLLSLSAAAELDRIAHKGADSGLSPEELDAVSTTYLSPVFKLSDDDHNAVLQEAEVMLAKVTGQTVSSAPLRPTAGTAQAKNTATGAPKSTEKAVDSADSAVTQSSADVVTS